MSKVNIVLFIFVLNVLVSVTAEYFPQGTLHSGLLRAGVMAVAIPLLMLRGVRMTRGGVILVVFLSYLLILVPFSSSPLDTLNTLLKVAISLLMFVISYNYIRGKKARRKLASIIPVCLALFIINFGVAQVFGLGKSFYHEAGFKTGGGGVQQTYLISYLVLFVPLLGHYRGTDFTLRKSDTLLMVLALFPLVLIGRRGAI